MSKHSNRFGRICGLALLVALLPSAAGAVDAVTPAPGVAQLPVTQAGSLSINWRVEDFAAAPREVFSPFGEFLLGGAVVAVVGQRLSRALTDTGQVTLTFGETLRVPRSLILQAAQQGVTLDYRRSFASSYEPDRVQAVVTLEPAGSGGGALSLARVEIDFGETEPEGYATVDVGAELRPWARIGYGGSGVLQASWLIADPSSTGGLALFRTQQEVRQLLNASENEVRVEGPVLPTNRPGIYELRFLVKDSDPEDAPRLFYHVR